MTQQPSDLEEIENSLIKQDIWLGNNYTNYPRVVLNIPINVLR